MLVGLGGLAEGADAGGNRFVRGSLRGDHMALRRCELLAGRGWGRIVVLALRFQLVNPGVDGVKALPDLLPAALPGFALVVHAPSMPPQTASPPMGAGFLSGPGSGIGIRMNFAIRAPR